MLKIDPSPFRPFRREISKKTLAAAARRIEKEKMKLPLFAHEVTITPLERAEANANDAMEHAIKLYNYYRHSHRELRRFWGEIPNEYRKGLEDAWLKCVYPKTPTYAFEWLCAKGWCKSKGELINGEFIVTHRLTIPTEDDE
jgi:hypothetical protein